MRALGIKLRSYAGNMHIVEDGHLSRRVLSLLFISTGVLGLAYMIILATIVFNIVERRNLESKVHVLTSEVGELELSFLSLSDGIDLNYSHSLGFREPEVKFTTRKSLGSIIGDNNEI